ncbi:acriflavin resistance protein [Desulfocarbo indianensis]|nr:acriflavin resistance protein [Desulfocarbo indianensis]
MKGPIAWFTDNHVAANLLMLFCLVGGLITAFTMKVEVFPETSLDKITVQVEYKGASPAEVEEAIITRVEERVAGLAGVRRIDSTAREGLGLITIEVVSGWDLQKLLDDVKAEVDRITTFPEEAEKPIVREEVRRTQVLWVAIFGDAPESTVKNLAENLRDDITALPGVTQADLFGVRTGEIHIEISEDTLRRHGLTLSQVASAVQQASLDLPAGSVKTVGGEILVRAKGRRYYAKEYGDIALLTKPDGSKLTLSQIAEISDGFEDTDLFARFQGQNAALIQVYRVADQNALDVAAKVKDFMEKVRPNLPKGINVDYFADRSEILRSRLDLLLRNMAMGLALVVIVLGLFLDLRLAFWVTLGIPISFAFGLWVLPPVDVSINMISLFAFILVLGIVVDDAIVVGENVFKKREAGMSAMKAAVEGTREVAAPVVFAVLTTLVAFVPLLLGSGSMGKVMRNIPVVVCVVLVGSLLESLFILPAHLARTKQARVRKEKKTTTWLMGVINGPYSSLLDFSLRWRYATVALGIMVLFLALGTFTSGILKFTLFPKVESDVLTANLTMPAGTPVERTSQVVADLERTAKEAVTSADKERAQDEPSLYKYTVSLVGVQAGGSGPHGGSPETGSHVATVFTQLLEGEKRDFAAAELGNRWRKETGVIPEAQAVTFSSDLFSAGNAIEVHLSSDDQEMLLTAADELKARLKTYPGVSDVADSWLPGKDELQLKLKPMARSLGLTLEDLSRQVRHAFYGAEALRLQRAQDEVKVMVRYPENERKSLGNIEGMRIRTPDGYEVPFSEVAQVSLEEGYASIERAQRRRVVKVTADVDEKVANAAELRGNLEKKVMPELVERYPSLRYDMEGEGREQAESLADVQQGLLLAIFGIYVLLAIPFRSFTQPLVVMAAIPFGIVGAVVGHLLMGHNLSLLSLFGIVGLSGVVVNDSLILIHRANALVAEGMTPGQAVREAGPHRFRAILLTSVTTFAGLTPIILERSLQAQFLIPMALSLGFGVLFATGITLLLIPSLYMILEDIHRLSARIKERLFGANPQDHPAG